MSVIAPTNKTVTPGMHESGARTAPGLIPLVAGSIAWLVGQAILPDMGLDWEQRLTAVRAARTAEMVSTLALFAAGGLYVVASTALRQRSHASPRPRLASGGAIALGLGGIWLCSGRAAFNLSMLKATDAGVQPDAALAVISASEGFAFGVFPVTLLALLIGPILLSLSAPGGRRAVWLPLALWVAGIGAFMVGEFTMKGLEIAGTFFANAGLVLAAAQHLSLTSTSRRKATV